MLLYPSHCIIHPFRLLHIRQQAIHLSSHCAATRKSFVAAGPHSKHKQQCAATTRYERIYRENGSFDFLLWYVRIRKQPSIAVIAFFVAVLFLFVVFFIFFFAWRTITNICKWIKSFHPFLVLSSMKRKHQFKTRSTKLSNMVLITDCLTSS